MLLAVVYPLTVVRGDLQHLRRLRDFQRAGYVRDLVVIGHDVSFSILNLRNGRLKFALVLADVRLTAADRDAGDFVAARKTFLLIAPLAVQRSIILNGVAVRGDDQADVGLGILLGLVLGILRLVVGILRVRRGALGGRRVVHSAVCAASEVALLHRVGVGDDHVFRAGLHFRKHDLIVLVQRVAAGDFNDLLVHVLRGEQRVGDLDVLNRHVVVRADLHRQRVGDLLTQRVGRAVLRAGLARYNVLDDLQRRLRLVGRVVGARLVGFGISAVRALAGDGCVVHDRAGQNVRFRYHVFNLHGDRLARLQLGDDGLAVHDVVAAASLDLRAFEVIDHFNVGNRQVAVVLHHDVVGDRLAQRVAIAVRRLAGRRLGGLGARVLLNRVVLYRCIGFIHRLRAGLLHLLAVFFYIIGVVNVVGVRGNLVQNASLDQVGFRHDVFHREGLRIRFAHSQRSVGRNVAGHGCVAFLQDVSKPYVGSRHVAVVRNLDGVGNLRANLKLSARGLALPVGGLGHNQRHVRRSQLRRVGINRLLAVVPLHVRYVANPAREDVVGGHNVHRLDLDHAIRLDVRDLRLVLVDHLVVAVHALLNDGVLVDHFDVLHRVDAHVLHRNGEHDLIAKVVVAVGLLVLNRLVRFDLVAGDRQRVGHERQLVVGRHVVALRVADDDFRRARLHGRLQLVLVLAHIGLAAGDVQRGFVHIVAFHQTHSGVARVEFDFALGVQLRAVRLAVVFHGVRLSDDLDLLVIVLAVAALGDLQTAGHFRDGLVLVVHLSASLVGDGHIGDDVVVVRAVRNVRYAAFNLRRHNVAGRQGRGFARCHSVALFAIRYGVAAVGMGLAVVLPRVAVRGDLDFGFVLLDLQRAGHVGDLVVLGYVVVIFVNDDRGIRHKFALVHANHGLAAVDGNRLHLVAVREVFRRVADVYLNLTRGIQLRAVRLAVVVDGVVRSDDLHLVFARAALGDGQLAIHHDEGYRREVAILVHEALVREVHEVVAHVRALGVRLRAVGKAEVILGVQRVADAHDFVAVHFMLLAVVLNRVLIAPDRHDHGVRRGDLQIALFVGDQIILGHVVALFVNDDRAAGNQLVRVHTHFGLTAVDGNRLHAVAFRKVGDRVAGANLDLILVVQLRAVRLAVVDNSVVRRLQLDLHVARAALGDLQTAGHFRDGLVLVVHHSASLVGDGHLGDDVVVVRAVRNVRYAAFHRRRHDVAGRQGLAFARLHFVLLAIIFHGVSAVGMRLAVVLPRLAVRGDGDGLLVLSDRQRAIYVLDVVVPGKRIVLQSMAGDLVLAAADKRLAANDRHGGKAFAFHKRARGDRVLVPGQRRAVVRLAGAGRRQLDGNRRYRQRTILALGEGVVLGNILAVARDLVALNDVVAAVGIGLAAFNDRFKLVAFHQHVFSVAEAAVGQRGSIVGLAGAVRGDGDLRRLRGNGQRAGILFDVVVGILEARALRVFDGILNRTIGHIRHAAGRLDVGYFARHKAVSGHGDSRSRQRRAVVFLARRLGGQRYLARVDGQLAINAVREGVVLGHVHVAAHDLVALNDVLAFVAHVRGAAFDNRRQNIAFHQHVFGVGEAVVRQRSSVVGLAVTLRGDGDGLLRDRSDHQLAILRIDDDVLSVLVHRADGALSEVRRVGANVGALRANGDVGEVRRNLVAGRVRVLARDGVAFHSPLRTIVDLLIAVRGQLYILIIVELDHVLALIRLDGQLLGLRAHGRVVFNVSGILGDLAANRGSAALGGFHLNAIAVRVHIAVPVVVNEVLVGVVQLVVIAGDILAPIAELDVRNVGQGAFGLLDSLLNVLGRHDVLRFHEHSSARRDGGNRRRVAIGRHRVEIVHVCNDFRHAVGYNDVLGFVLAHVLHGDGVGDLVANGVVGFGLVRGFLLGIERIVARDGQGAVVLLDRVVSRHVAVGVSDLRGGDLRDCLIHADQRLRVLVVIQHVYVQGVARQQTSVAVRRFNGIANYIICRMRHGVRVVVGIRQQFSGNLHEALVDDQLAVVHNELDVREVLAGVLEVAFLQIHRVGARVGFRHLVGAAEGEVRFLIKRVVDAYVVALRGVLRAVVRRGCLVTRDRHDHFVRYSRNRQLAGGLGDGVVLGNVHVVLVENLHRAGELAFVLALIRALGYVGQVFFHVLMAGLQTNNRDAGDGLLFAVVHLLRAFAREGHGEARVGDGQLAGGLGNVVVLRYDVALGILNNHVAVESAVVAANVLAFRLVAQLVGMAFHKTALLDTGNALHAAGVGEGLAFAGEGHVALRDGQIAVRHNKLHIVEVAVVVRKVGILQTHRVAARVDGGLLGLAVEVEVGSRVPVVADAYHLVAGHGVLRAVIRRVGRMTLDRHGHFFFDRVDPEVFLLYRDVIVRLFEVVACGIGDVIQHLALVHVRHAAVGLDVGHFAFHKALTSHGDIRLRQRRAVVGLVPLFGDQRHDAPVDGQPAVLFHDELHVREVLLIVVHKQRIIQTHHVRSIARVGFFHLGSAIVGEILLRVQLVLAAILVFDGNKVALYAVPIAVVSRGFRDTIDPHNHFVGHGRNFQLTRFGGDGVVVRVRAFVQRVGEGVVDLAYVRDRAGHVKRRAFASHETLAADGHVAVRKRLAVVDLISARGRQRHGALVDGQFAFLIVHPIIGRNRAARIRLARIHDIKLVDHV